MTPFFGMVDIEDLTLKVIHQGIIFLVPQFDFRPRLLGILPVWINRIEESAILGCRDLVLTDLIVVGDSTNNLVVE